MISRSLRVALERRNARKGMVLTVNPDGAPPSGKRHLATQPGSYVLSTAPGISFADPDTSRGIEVLPWILRWPTVSKKINILERRAEIAQSEVELLADSGLSERLSRGAQVATYSLDLWCEGVGLTEMYRLMSGRIVDPPTRPRRNSGISLPIIDGDPTLDRSLVGKFTQDIFGDLPEDIIDTDRTLLFGPVQFRTIAVQIDREGFLFYCFDGEPSEPIQQVEKDGQPLSSSAWSQEVISTPQLTYTAIRLRDPIENNPGGVSNIVTFSGGAGQRIDGVNPIEQLLYLTGYELSDRAIAASRSISRQIPITIDNSDSAATALQILVDRVMGQTNSILTLSNGVVDIIPIEIGRSTDAIPMTLGDNLLYRIPLSQSETPLGEVYSQVEVRCGRDQFGSSTSNTRPLWTIFRSATVGPSRIQKLLARAKTLLGQDRTLTIEANDLLVWFNEDYRPYACPPGESLADLYAMTHAYVHQLHAYKANWVDGLLADRGEIRSLTDDNESISAEKCIVTEQLITDATGPILTFQTEDTD